MKLLSAYGSIAIKFIMLLAINTFIPVSPIINPIRCLVMKRTVVINLKKSLNYVSK